MRTALIFTVLAGLVSAIPGDASDNANANGLQNGNHNGHGNGKGPGRKCKPKQPKPSQSEQPQVSQAPSESAVSPSATEPASTEPTVSYTSSAEASSAPAVSYTSSAEASSAPASSAAAESSAEESAPAESASAEPSAEATSVEPSAAQPSESAAAPTSEQPADSAFSMNDMKVGEPVTEPARELLQLHNDERAKYGASPLEWDEGLAATAAEWSSKCVWQHSGSGENLAMGTFGYYTGADMFKMWVDEVQWYNWAAPGPNPIPSAPENAAVGHWTQIVWKGSAKVGCAYNRCAAGKLTGDEALYVVCHFDPSGNVVYGGSPDQGYVENVGTAV